MCKAEGHIRAASVVDHIKEHKGNPALFWDEGNLQSLCKRHHDSDKQRLERGGTPTVRVDVDGWPLV